MNKDVTFTLTPNDGSLIFSLAIQDTTTGKNVSAGSGYTQKYQLTADDTYFYHLRAAGPSGSTYKLTIQGATTATQPVTGTIVGAYDDVSDQFVA